MVIDLSNYKLAKKFMLDSETLLPIIEEAIKALVPYRHYKPSGEALHQLQKSKADLKAYQNKARKILNEK